jgi:hypothetical protein
VYPCLCVLSGYLPRVTLCLGTPCRCMVSVLVLIARFLSLGHCRILLGGTPFWNAASAASTISFSAARLPRLIARILLICGLISWISCLVTLSRPHACARHCVLTLLTLQRGVNTHPLLHVRSSRGTLEDAFGSSATTAGLLPRCRYVFPSESHFFILSG